MMRARGIQSSTLLVAIVLLGTLPFHRTVLAAVASETTIVLFNHHFFLAKQESGGESKKLKDVKFTPIPESSLRDEGDGNGTKTRKDASEHEYGLVENISETDILPSNQENLPIKIDLAGKLAGLIEHNTTHSGESESEDKTQNSDKSNVYESRDYMQPETHSTAENLAPEQWLVPVIFYLFVIAGILLIVTFVVFQFSKAKRQKNVLLNTRSLRQESEHSTSSSMNNISPGSPKPDIHHLIVELMDEMQQEFSHLRHNQNRVLDAVLRPIRQNDPIAFENDITSDEYENGELKSRLERMEYENEELKERLNYAEQELAESHHNSCMQKARHQELVKAVDKLLRNLADYLLPQQARSGFPELDIDIFNAGQLQHVEHFFKKYLQTEQHLVQKLDEKNIEYEFLSAELSELKQNILGFYSSLLKTEPVPESIPELLLQKVKLEFRNTKIELASMREEVAAVRSNTLTSIGSGINENFIRVRDELTNQVRDTDAIASGNKTDLLIALSNLRTDQQLLDNEVKRFWFFSLNQAAKHVFQGSSVNKLNSLTASFLEFFCAGAAILLAKDNCFVIPPEKEGDEPFKAMHFSDFIQTIKETETSSN